MNSPTLIWIVAMAVLASAVLVAVYLLLKPPPRSKPLAALPTDWPLAPRGVFSPDERRAYRVLSEALPRHVILSKLPLVRFCQPRDPSRQKYWYELLGATHVGFAICSPGGRVLAAIDLEAKRPASRRGAQVKQSVLSACGVRYLRCPVANLPTMAELQLLVPQHLAARPAHPESFDLDLDLDDARDSLNHAVATRRAERSTLWRDSNFVQDSFFERERASRPAVRTGAGLSEDGDPSDIVGVVVYHLNEVPLPRNRFESQRFTIRR